VKRQSESPLLLLAVIGIILYLTVIGSSYLQDPGETVEAESQYPVITKQEAANAAVHFVQERFGLSPGYRTGTWYQSNSTRSGYLQKEHLDDEYMKRFENLPIDYYEVEINA
jgi:hypothetical protein